MKWEKLIAEMKLRRTNSNYKGIPQEIKITKKQKNKKDRMERASRPSIRIAGNLRTRLAIALKGKGKSSKTMTYVGCSKEELIKHLESLFKKEMSWSNYGLHGWHIDHIIPLSFFDLTKEENIYKAMNYKNLQPLWAFENLSKSDKVIHIH